MAGAGAAYAKGAAATTGAGAAATTGAGAAYAAITPGLGAGLPKATATKAARRTRTCKSNSYKRWYKINKNI